MHDDIKRFSLHGELAEANLVTTKARLVDWLENQMRDTGFVPSLDLEPQFTLDYRPERNVYEFDLSVYGVNMEGESCSRISGVTSGRKIMRYTPKVK